MHQAKYTTLSAGWANLVFMAVTVTLIGGSALLALLGFPAIGVIYNQGVIFGAAALLAWKGGWSWREVFRLKPTRGSYIWLAVAAGLSAWWFNAGILVAVQRWLDQAVGPMPDLLPDFGPWGIAAILFASLFLAPISEEVLFRGYIQRAYEHYSPRRAWVISGLLFGLLHVGNSLTSVVTASLLGMVLGYVVWRSDSLFPAIAAHFAINLSALAFALPIQRALAAADTPWWLAFASLSGLAALACFLKKINGLADGDQLGSGQTETVFQASGGRTDSRALRVIPLVIALLVLAVPACSEVAIRMGLVELTLQKGQNHVSRDQLEGELDLVSILVAADQGNLNLSYTINSEEMQAAMEIVAPDGRIMWRQRWQEEGPTGSTNSFSLKLDQPGHWLVRLTGSAKELDLTVSWWITSK